MLQDNDQIVLRYVDSLGRRGRDTNPNGSVDDIAGILNKGKNVLGMMPHPERAVDEAIGGISGRRFFESMI